MDSGSFVYEDDGVRWVREPGMPSYSKSEPVIKKMKKSLWKQNQESVRWKITVPAGKTTVVKTTLKQIK